jgi:hypothetical protein
MVGLIAKRSIHRLHLEKNAFERRAMAAQLKTRPSSPIPLFNIITSLRLQMNGDCSASNSVNGAASHNPMNLINLTGSVAALKQKKLNAAYIK